MFLVTGIVVQAAPGCSSAWLRGSRKVFGDRVSAVVAIVCVVVIGTAGIIARATPLVFGGTLHNFQKPL